MDKERLKQITREFLNEIGEDILREGLKDTPVRVSRMYEEVFKGYDEIKKPKITVFPNNTDGIHMDEMIIDTGNFFSFCEHHLLPFWGKYYFGYIPEQKVVGLSKIARLIEWYCSRLQVQERLTKQIVDELEKELDPHGIALILKARHFCKEMRGIKQVGGEMITTDMRRAFRTNINTRQEFLQLIK